jgi:hypothetical protein
MGTDRWTDQPTDRQTDEVSNRGAFWCLKREKHPLKHFLFTNTLFKQQNSLEFFFQVQRTNWFLYMTTQISVMTEETKQIDIFYIYKRQLLFT